MRPGEKHEGYLIFSAILRARCMDLQATGSLMANVVMPVAKSTYCLLQSLEACESAPVHVRSVLI